MDADVYYHHQIVKMAYQNQQTLEVNMGHAIANIPMVAAWIMEAPKDIIPLLDQVVTEIVLSIFPHYDGIHKEIYVRFTDIPSCENIRDLRTLQLNYLLRVIGVVTRRSSVFPQLKLVKYNCASCGALLGPFVNGSNNNASNGKTNGNNIKLNSCPECTSKGPFHVNNEQTIYQNYQRITLQEAPQNVPPGRVPRSKEVVLLNDLIDKVRPGDEVSVIGIYCHTPDIFLNMRQSFPVFNTIIEANNITKNNNNNGSDIITQQDKDRILKLAKDPNIIDRLLKSFCPSIYGHEQIKISLLLSIFGGNPKKIKNSRIRGDINVLLLGDPGTAKSQFLKYITKVINKSVYSTGKGASAVGLTAGVTRDPITKEWVLQGGALVLADQGLCLIDEFDKMNEQDRTSIHEAMEQQSISISKAGIVTSLQARCGVIAAANPIGGRYNNNNTFAQNVDLTDPILQRFDLLCVLQDNVNPANDERLADFVVTSHIQSLVSVIGNHNKSNINKDNEDNPDDNDDPVNNDNPDNNDISVSINENGNNDKENISNHSLNKNKQNDMSNDPNMKNNTNKLNNEEYVLDQDILKKYIIYARNNIKPIMNTNIDMRKIGNFYAEIRRESQSSGAVPIAVRHLESLFRISEAFAKMELRNSIRNDDIDMAMKVMISSLVECQKCTLRNQWKKKFNKYLNYK